MLENGSVAEAGTYNELMRRRDRFASMIKGETWEKDHAKVKRRSLYLLSKTNGIETNS